MVTIGGTTDIERTALGSEALDADALREDFPILNREETDPVGSPLVFLDSAASSQKPRQVIDAVSTFYETSNANIHRGVYELSEAATAVYEEARRKVAWFINAASARECIFLRNATEGLNLIAQTWGREHLGMGDIVLLTELEHHSNIIPWQIVAEQTGARIEWVRVSADGRLDQEHYLELLELEPKVVALTHVSNAIGTVTPLGTMIPQARDAGAELVVVDAAQSAPHMPLDVQHLDADAVALSGHKMLGPMGAGVLYGKRAMLESLPPFLGGGAMIRKVGRQISTWADVPARFEAGTPAVADAVGLGAAIDYLGQIGMEPVHAHEAHLANYALQRLGEVPGLTIVGPRDGADRAAVISFTLGELHPHDVASILDEQNIAVRAGHHCAQPLMESLGLVATTRASFYLYNTEADVDRLVEGLDQARRIFM